MSDLDYVIVIFFGSVQKLKRGPTLIFLNKNNGHQPN